MKKTRLTKRVIQFGSYLLLYCFLNVVPVMAQTQTTTRLNVAKNKNPDINFSVDKLNWTKISQKEKENFLTELNKITLGLKDVNKKVEEIANKELFRSELISDLTKLSANAIENIDLKELESVLTELFTSVYEGVTTIMKNNPQPFKDLLIRNADNSLMHTIELMNEYDVVSRNRKSVTVKKRTTQRHKYYILKPEMISVSPIPYNNGRPNGYIKSIETGKDATMVTFVNAIHFVSNWTQFPSSCYFLDIENDERHYPISIEKNIPLDSLLLIRGHKRQMIEFIVKFPSFNRNAKKLIYCDKPSEKIKSPSNSSPSENILIIMDQFKPVKKGLIIRELMNKKLVICDSEGYMLNSHQYDTIEKIKYKKEIGYKCTMGKEVRIFNIKGNILYQNKKAIKAEINRNR